MTDPLSLGFPYAHDLIEAVEESSCALGCVHARPLEGFGPGGACDRLAAAAVEEDVPFIRTGLLILCLDRKAPPPPEPTVDEPGLW